MSSIRTVAPILVALLWLATAGNHAAWAQSAPTDEALRAPARTGLALLMDGNLEESIAVFREIQKADPQSPLGEMLEANALWWRIFYSTANLVDPDVFITPQSSTPHDAQFENLLNAAIAKSEARIKAEQEVPRSHLYAGMAYGLRGRLVALRNKGLPTARAAKKMRSLLLEAVQHDPNLADAYAGIGNYNYFVDTLSALVKLLGFFIGLPGGNRVEGLKQLQRCVEKGELARAAPSSADTPERRLTDCLIESLIHCNSRSNQSNNSMTQ
jgi:tetratricopeptide (TPR) repeat protein